MDDDGFIDGFVARAAAIPGVVAVALGGSRAHGLEHAGSDWDFAIYYRGRLDADDVRAAGWEGQVFAPGDWGGGVMNGGAFLRVDGRKVDLHYRDLDEVEHHWAEAREGRFRIERLPFYLAGIPTYTVVGELALCRVLHGELPRPEYPPALAQSGQREWHAAALLSLDAAAGYAAREMPVETVGSLARALLEEGHARAAAAQTWVLNEKRLLATTGLDAVESAFVGIGRERPALERAVDQVRRVVERAGPRGG